MYTQNHCWSRPQKYKDFIRYEFAKDGISLNIFTWSNYQ